jgi:hypothetical protein
MNRASFILGVSLLATSAFGQGGSWYIGGTGSYSSSSSDADLNPTMSSWTFNPEVGTFFNAKWSAGLTLGLGGSTTSNDDGDLSESSQFLPSVYGRRWWSAGDKLGLFAGLDVAFGSGSSSTFTPEEVEVETSSFGVNLNAGVAYAFADRWTFLMKFATLGYRTEEVGEETTNSFGLMADSYATERPRQCARGRSIGLQPAALPTGGLEGAQDGHLRELRQAVNQEEVLAAEGVYALSCPL